MFDFSDALRLLRQGKHMTRAGWNGRGLYVYLVPEYTYYLPFLMMCTVEHYHVPWLASQTDLLAFDWMIHGVEA